MTTLAARGSGTPTTNGTTWATVTNAVDGAAGSNPATYTTYTNATASAVGYIEISGYNFSSSIGTSDTLNSVTVNLRHFENNTGRFASVRFQPYDGATAIGTIFTATLATAARNDSTTFPVTLAQLRSSTFKIRVTVTGAASTQSRVESIDYVDVTADYTIAPPSITQAAYRFYNDGTESASTALAAQDTGYTADTSAGDVNLQVRARLQSTTAIAVPATDDWQLQWERNTSGTWTDVTAPAGLADAFLSYVNSTGLETGAAWIVGQSFRGDGRLLTRAGFRLGSGVTPNGTLTAVLYAHSGTFGTTSVATGSALATSNAINSISIIPGTIHYFDFDGTFTLTDETPYVIALTTTNTVTGGVAVGKNDSGTHEGSFTQYSGVWSSAAPTTKDLIFEVYTEPAAAPTTAVPYASANLTDAAATTNRLGAGSGSFVAGKVSEDGLVDNLGWTANNYTEVLYSVTLKQADLSPSDTLRFRVLRNGATTDLTYTAYPSVTIGGGGPTDRTGTATGSITLAGSATGTKDVTATAAGTLTLTGTASGSAAAAPVLGTAAGTITVAGVAVGVHGVTATATGTLAVAGAATGQKTVAATAASSLTVAGTSSGVRGRPGLATGAVTLTGTATGVRTFNGVATGTIALAGTASGVKTVTATATGQLTVAGVSTGSRVLAGTATGSVTLAGTATGQKTVRATATGALTVAGTATAIKQVAATATGQIVFGSTALGLVEGNAVGTAVGTITLGGTATGARGTKATASGSLTLSGAATARRGTAGTATGLVQLQGLALGRRIVIAAATGQLQLQGTALGIGAGAGTGVATGTITVTGLAAGISIIVGIIGQWNDQEVDAMQWGDEPVVDWYMVT